MKTVLITGGSRGIGAGAAELFVSRGWLPFTCARNTPRTEDAVPGALFIPCDVRDESQVIDLRDRVLSKAHHLDALVLCAGTAWRGLIQDMPTEAFDDLTQVHLKGAFLLVKHFLPSMISRGCGSIVFVSSMWGQAGASCEAAYSAVKAGQIGLAKALAKECGPSGIRVNALCPGYIPTRMNESLPGETAGQMIGETPLGRLGTVQDCAQAVYFLCSDESSFITGQVIGVNGGMII